MFIGRQRVDGLMGKDNCLSSIIMIDQFTRKVDALNGISIGYRERKKKWTIVYSIDSQALRHQQINAPDMKISKINLCSSSSRLYSISTRF